MASMKFASAIDTCSRPPRPCCAPGPTPEVDAGPRGGISTTHEKCEVDSGIVSFVDDGCPTVLQTPLPTPYNGYSLYNVNRAPEVNQKIREPTRDSRLEPPAEFGPLVDDTESPLTAARHQGTIKPISGDLLRRLYQATQDEKRKASAAVAHGNAEHNDGDAPKAAQISSRRGGVSKRGFYIPKELVRAVREQDQKNQPSYRGAVRALPATAVRPAREDRVASVADVAPPQAAPSVSKRGSVSVRVSPVQAAAAVAGLVERSTPEPKQVKGWKKGKKPKVGKDTDEGARGKRSPTALQETSTTGHSPASLDNRPEHSVPGVVAQSPQAFNPSKEAVESSAKASRSAKNTCLVDTLQPRVESADSSKASDRKIERSRTAVSSKTPSIRAPSTKATSVKPSPDHAPAAPSFISFEEVGQGTCAGSAEKTPSKQQSRIAVSLSRSDHSADDAQETWKQRSMAMDHSKHCRADIDVPGKGRGLNSVAAAAAASRRLSPDVAAFAPTANAGSSSQLSSQRNHGSVASDHGFRAQGLDDRQSRQEKHTSQYSARDCRSSMASQLPFEEIAEGWHRNGESVVERNTTATPRTVSISRTSDRWESTLRPTSQGWIERHSGSHKLHAAPGSKNSFRLPQQVSGIPEQDGNLKTCSEASSKHASEGAHCQCPSTHDWPHQSDSRIEKASPAGSSTRSRRDSFAEAAGPDYSRMTFEEDPSHSHGSRHSARSWRDAGDGVAWAGSPRPNGTASHHPAQEPYIRPPTVFAGKGWISPHPLSRSPTEIASPPQSKIILPSEAFARGATMTYEEWKQVQERGMKAHRNFSFTESSHGKTTKLRDKRFKFAGWGAQSSDAHRFEQDNPRSATSARPPSRAPTVDSEHSSHGNALRASLHSPSAHSRVRTISHAPTHSHRDRSPSEHSGVHTLLSAWSHDHSGSKQVFDGSEASADASQMEREWEVMEEGRNVWSDVPQYDDTEEGRWECAHDAASRTPTSLLYGKRYRAPPPVW